MCFEANLLLLLRLLLLFGMKQDATNDEARMMNDELPPITRRECASFTLISSKYSSQYGRSSASGGSQKQVSTQVATLKLSTRACSMLCRYSSPAIEPRPSARSSIACTRARSLPDLTAAFTR